MDKYGRMCSLINGIVLVLLWAICILLVFLLSDNWIIRIIVIIISFFPCAWLEERILSSFVNETVETWLKRHRFVDIVLNDSPKWCIFQPVTDQTS